MKINRHLSIVAAAALGSAFSLVAAAKTDLVTLPSRASVQLTIYNSADLTLVRESRLLTLRKGLNSLQFSWENTLIDPTSLEMTPKAHGDKITIDSLSYPPRVEHTGVWRIQSEIQGKVPVEITYLTSGLSWRAFYHGILSEDEQSMRIEAYVRVMNQSGEDYENASTRLIVGTIRVLDEIAALAQRRYPYGMPYEPPVPMAAQALMVSGGAKRKEIKCELALKSTSDADFLAPKAIVKEGLSEYFLYTIEGTETIPHGWAKRLPSFTADGVAITNLYKYEEERYGARVMRFVSFVNDRANNLGETPIPGGVIRMFRTVDAQNALAYEGQSEFKYIPVNKDVELNLGPAENVIVECKLMDFKTSNYMFDSRRDICGWDETRDFKFEVKNTRRLPVRVEIKRRLPVSAWEIKTAGDCGKYEKIDLFTVKFTMLLPPESKREFHYTVTTRHGTRAEQ